MLKTLTAALCLLVPTLHAQTASPEQVRSAASRGVAAVQHGSAGFYKLVGCFSCHDHALPMLALQVARERGFKVDEAIASQAAKGLQATPDLSSIDRAVQDNAIIDPAASDGWALIAARAIGLKPNLATAAYARRIASWQLPDGHWATVDARPPESYSLFTATAVAVHAMQLDMPSQLRQETDDRVARAKNWLLSNQPVSTEDSTFRLFGLHRAGATSAELERAAHDLLARQLPDGGWPELPRMASDAYSTGEALVALHEAGGTPTDNAAWQKGLTYLLSSQDKGGSWHVRTRMISPAKVSPPYFETGFPYGHDQFLSTAATCWASVALMLDLPKVADPPVPPPMTVLSPQGLQPWMEAALFGTTAELKTLLDGGLDPNSKTAEGTTLLMMAAPDAQKVKLLIDRGADVRAKAKTGFTALMVATTYRDTSESVKLLLDHGAEARPGTGVLYDASPLLLASMAGDRDNVGLLLAKGADPNRKMTLLGLFASSPLFQAVGFGDAAMVEALLKGGANVKEKDDDGMTALHWAAIANRTDAVRVLLAAGADANAVDSFGYTPLLYASTIDFGTADTARALLKAGANPNLKEKGGKTALAQAREYTDVRTALEEAGAKQ